MRWYDYLTINLFWLGLNIRNTALGSIFMPYLVGIFAPEAIKNTALGVMRSAGLVIAMLVQPAAGLLSDRSTSRFGRRRPYILIGALFDCLFLAAIALAWNYWALLIAVLLIQFSSNISHGPLQGLIPDLVPEDQRGRASAIKAIMELLPIILVGLTIARIVGAGHLNLAIFVTGISLLIVTLITIIFVKETPLQEKPTTPFWPPMVRVLGMLGGIVIGAVTGLLGGGLVGGLVGLITLVFAEKATALSVGIGVGGAVAMIVAVVTRVWAGALGTLGKEARKQSSFVWWIVNRLMFLAAATSI
ncbi:MAG: MFS transporter, partial [Chloroflexi bacterium]|nr:MFS transporter [Chloroflexota bacterium]